jgi:hypothetical protein
MSNRTKARMRHLANLGVTLGWGGEGVDRLSGESANTNPFRTGVYVTQG